VFACLALTSMHVHTCGFEARRARASHSLVAPTLQRERVEMIKYLEWLRSICPVVMSAYSVMYARVWRSVHVPAACEPIETWGVTCSTHDSRGVSSGALSGGSSVQPGVSDVTVGVCNSADTCHVLNISAQR
jgi:hypothetical protein